MASARQAITGSLRPATTYESTLAWAPAPSRSCARLLVEVIGRVGRSGTDLSVPLSHPSASRAGAAVAVAVVVEGPWSPARPPLSAAAGLSLSGGASITSSVASQVGHHLGRSGSGTKKGGPLGPPSLVRSYVAPRTSGGTSQRG